MKYFTHSEFDSPDEPGSGKNMRQEFLEMLDCAREEAMTPFKITSGFRTEAYNKDLQKRGYLREDTYEYIVFEPEQIHVLGSKQDIQGFTKFVSKPEAPVAPDGDSKTSPSSLGFATQAQPDASYKHHPNIQTHQDDSSNVVNKFINNRSRKDLKNLIL